MNFTKLAQIKTFPKNIKGQKTLFHAPWPSHLHWQVGPDQRQLAQCTRVHSAPRRRSTTGSHRRWVHWGRGRHLHAPLYLAHMLRASVVQIRARLELARGHGGSAAPGMVATDGEAAAWQLLTDAIQADWNRPKDHARSCDFTKQHQKWF